MGAVNMSENAISIVSLEKSFSNEQVLKGVDFSIEPSELCVIVGPSGSGKSTLLRCIAGLVSFDRGEVLIDGASVGSIPVEKRDLGYVFQDFEERLFPHMTVGENVAFGLRQSDQNFSDEEIQQRVDESLELLAITETKESLPSELSGGQQQRVELARNLVRKCDIMLLDDPLADLDYKLQKRMELEIRRIHETLGSTFVYVTHNQDQALKLADKLVVINQGMIEQIGTPDEVYQNPATAFVARFIGDSDPLLGEVTSTDGENVLVDTPVGELVAKPRDDVPEVGTEVMILVRPEDITIGPETGELDNDLPVSVQGRTYTGERTEFTVRLDGDAEDFQVVVSGNVPLEAFGNRTRIGWNADEGIAYDTLSVVETVTVDDLMEV